MANEDTRRDWVDDIKVTFDSEELAAFFDGFVPLEIGDDGFPCFPEEGRQCGPLSTATKAPAAS